MANKKEIKLTLSVDPQLGGVKMFETALEQSLNSISATARAAGQRVDGAMKSLGVKSSAQIKKEINSIRQAFDMVKGSGTASARDINLAWNKSQQKIAALRKELKGVGTSFSTTSKSLQGSRVVDMLTEHLGVNRGELRKMAESGQITADVMRAAFAGGIASVNDEFAQLPITVGQSMTLLRNEWGKIVADFNKSEGVTGGLADGMKLLADNLELVISGAYRLVVAMLLIGGSLAVDGGNR